MDATRKVGRPRKTESRAEALDSRPAKRVPIQGFRDKLTVDGLDPDYVYRWILDAHENGQRIEQCQAAGYNFVRKEDGVIIGQNSVHQSETLGSIIRISEADDSYLYLMRIRKEYYEEDQKAKNAEVDALQHSMNRNTGKTPGKDDLYGSVKIG